MDVAVSQFFESIRNPFLDFIAKTFSLMGEPIFLVVLICAVYWLIDKKLGERLAVVTFTSMIFNAFIKGSVLRLRPYMTGTVSRVESTGLVDTMSLTNNQSFPSGHSQINAGITFGTASFYRKTVWWIVALIITLGTYSKSSGCFSASKSTIMNSNLESVGKEVSTGIGLGTSIDLRATVSNTKTIFDFNYKKVINDAWDSFKNWLGW